MDLDDFKPIPLVNPLPESSLSNVPVNDDKRSNTLLPGAVTPGNIRGGKNIIALAPPPPQFRDIILSIQRENIRKNKRDPALDTFDKILGGSDFDIVFKSTEEELTVPTHIVFVQKLPPPNN